MTRTEAKEEIKSLEGVEISKGRLYLIDRIYNEFESRSCNGCKHDWCGCSVQDSILRIDSEVRFDSFCCNKWEAK